LSTIPTRSTRGAALSARPLSAAVELARLIEAAENAPGDLVKVTDYSDGSQRFQTILKRDPVAGGGLSLRAMLPELLDANGRLRRTPEAVSGASSIRLDTAIARASRVVQAGAALLISEDRTEAVPNGPSDGAPAMYQDTAGYRIVNPMPLATITPDDADITATPWANVVQDARANWGTAPIIGAQVVIPRRRLKDTEPGGDDLVGELLTSLVLGLANAADRLLLAQIAAASPTAFTLAKAAAARVRFEELKALVGTSGTGAAVGQDGQLRAGGIAAELTGEAAGTIVGAFDRSALLIRDRIEVLIERRDVAGRQRVTAWATMAPLVPTGAAHFWSL
jgi:hypothetical protein